MVVWAWLKAPWPEGDEWSGCPEASMGFHMLSKRKPGLRTPIAQDMLFTVISRALFLFSEWTISQ